MSEWKKDQRVEKKCRADGIIRWYHIVKDYCGLKIITQIIKHVDLAHWRGFGTDQVEESLRKNMVIYSLVQVQ